MEKTQITDAEIRKLAHQHLDGTGDHCIIRFARAILAATPAPTAPESVGMIDKDGSVVLWANKVPRGSMLYAAPAPTAPNVSREQFDDWYKEQMSLGDSCPFKGKNVLDIMFLATQWAISTPAPTAPSDAQEGHMVAKGVEGCPNHVWASTHIVGAGPGYICTNCGATWQPHVCR